LDNDNIEEALPSVKFLSDKRFKHLYDQHQTVGKAIASSVGWNGKIAWDIYLFYAPYSEWTDKPPSPSYWMHQLTDNWATKEKYRTGADLKNELLVSIEKLLSV
jgi:NADH:ubiquinone oxidoreductase subunit